MIEAAALPETLFTVWSNLFDSAQVTEGSTVMVHGGTSGIGTMAISLGRLFGLTVIVTCGSDQKCARALNIGAAHAINYRTHDFVEEVKRITNGQGVTVVLDMVAGEYTARNLEVLAEAGRLVIIATQGGANSTINILKIMQKRISLTGSTLRPRPTAFKQEVKKELLRQIWPRLARGELRIVIDKTFGMGEAAAAHQYMESGAHIGKILLTMDD